MDRYYMDKYYVEELILTMADIVYENRELRKQNEELLKEREKNRKFSQELLDTNLKNTVNFLEKALNKSKEEKLNEKN